MAYIWLKYALYFVGMRCTLGMKYIFGIKYVNNDQYLRWNAHLTNCVKQTYVMW